MNPETTNKVADCVREKYWSELGIEEKLERMRSVIKNEISENENTRGEFSNLKTLFRRHQHNKLGDLLFRLGNDFNQSPVYHRQINKSENPNECYF